VLPLEEEERGGPEAAAARMIPLVVVAVEEQSHHEDDETLGAEEGALYQDVDDTVDGAARLVEGAHTSLRVVDAAAVEEAEQHRS
jgi:hypothetical protein